MKLKMLGTFVTDGATLLLGILTGALAARLLLMLDSSLSVRYLLQLHRHGLSWVVSSAMKTKLWLRQRVKALLYASRLD